MTFGHQLTIELITKILWFGTHDSYKPFHPKTLYLNVSSFEHFPGHIWDTIIRVWCLSQNPLTIKGLLWRGKVVFNKATNRMDLNNYHTSSQICITRKHFVSFNFKYLKILRCIHFTGVDFYFKNVSETLSTFQTAKSCRSV